MPSLSVPPHLIQYIGSAQISHWQAAEALEEWIWQRRNKGDTLFEVSVGLLDLEDRVRFGWWVELMSGTPTNPRL